MAKIGAWTCGAQNSKSAKKPDKIDSIGSDMWGLNSKKLYTQIKEICKKKMEKVLPIFGASNIKNIL